MNDPYSPSSGDVATQLAGLAIIFVVSIFFGALVYALMAIPLAALFRKTGIAPWKAWVPFYSTYVWLRLGGQSGHWLWASLVPYGSILTSVFLYIGMYRTGKAFGKDSGFLVLAIFLPVIWLFILGFGRDAYVPERITAAGLGGPLEGYGSPQSAGAQPWSPQQPWPAQPPQHHP